MTDAFPVLSLAERDRRWQAACELMDEQGVDALLVFGDRDGSGSPLWATDHWLTNDRIGAYVLYPRNGVPIAHVWATNSMVDHMESVGRGETVWLAADQFRLGRTGEAILRSVADLGLAKASFGVVGIHRMAPFFVDGIVPYGTYAALLDGLPGATFKDVGDEYAKLVNVRSPEVWEMLRKSAASGELMCEAAIEATRVGATDADVLAAIAAAGIRDGSWPWYTILADGDENLSWGAPSWVYRGGGPRPIKNGDLLLFEIMPFYGIYETQQQLAIAVGEIDADAERAAIVTREAYDAGIQALAGGARTFGDVDDAMTSLIRAAGGWNLTPNIHTIPHAAVGGLGPEVMRPEMQPYPDMGRSRNPAGGANLELVPGMVYAIQPNTVFGRRRVNIGGTVIVNDDGIEELNVIPNDLVRIAG